MATNLTLDTKLNFNPFQKTPFRKQSTINCFPPERNNDIEHRFNDLLIDINKNKNVQKIIKIFLFVDYF